MHNSGDQGEQAVIDLVAISGCQGGCVHDKLMCNLIAKKINGNRITAEFGWRDSGC